MKFIFPKAMISCKKIGLIGALIAFLFLSCFYQNALARPINLSLDDAIKLALRDNPIIKSSELSNLSEKYNLQLQEWMFYPHYSLQASGVVSASRSHGFPWEKSKSYNIQPGVSWVSPIGTQVDLNATNQKTEFYNPGLALSITQPLIRGFGKPIVEAALNNAKDSNKISFLNTLNTLQNTVTGVINAYLDVVSVKQTILIDEDALKRSATSLAQTKLFIKAGHKAPNELVTVLANVASAKSQLENDKNNLDQAKYALLTAIGLNPNTPFLFSSVDLNKLIKKYRVPSKEETKHLVLSNDIQYQISKIMIDGPVKRSVMLAKDSTRWQLNLTANVATGNGATGGLESGLQSLWNGVNQAQSIGLTLQIPIDDQSSKQALINAKIAMQQARLAYRQEKWSKETSAINSWNTVTSAKRSLIFSEDANRLQEKTYNISYQKYLHGLIDSLELQTALIQLIQAQQTLLNARISYLKSLINLDLLIGHTLKTWHIHLRKT